MLHVLLFVAVVVLTIRWLSSKPPNFPPGPFRWPVVGNLVEAFLYSKGDGKHVAIQKLSKKYGGLMGLFFGSEPTIVVSDYKLIRELGVMDVVSGRPINRAEKFSRKNGRKLGIIFNHGDAWQEQRRFSIRHMKHQGYGKIGLEASIHEEVHDLLHELSLRAGADHARPVEVTSALAASSLNLIWHAIAREQYGHGDARGRTLAHHIETVLGRLDASGNAYAYFPWLASILPTKYLPRFQELLDHRITIMNFIKERVDAHSQTLDEQNPRDFIDIYLSEMRQREEKSSFSEEQLVHTIFDMFLAGFDTTYNSMAFSLLFMVCNPRVQAKVQAEIDSVVGKNRLPGLADRQNLPYVEATIEEVFRAGTVVPIGVPHAVLYASRDIPFHEYVIPARCRILFSLSHVHNDKALWGDPENFRPERFIGDDNKVHRPEYLMPFGHGKRQCMGETLARRNMFLFFTAILQKFELSVPEGSRAPDPESTQGVFTLGPLPYQAKISPRF